MKIASGGGKPASAAGARRRRPRAPARRRRRHCGGCARRARRAPRWRWRAASGSASIHSIATEPEPAPMSQSSSPRRGASDDSVTARISRLVIWPSCSNRSSASPAARAMTRAPASGHDLDRHDVERIDRVPRSKSAAVVARMRSRGPPSASSTVRREAPKPVLVEQAARARPAPSPSEVSARMRAPGCRCGRTRSSVRPCSESGAVSGSAQPSRAAARLKAEGAGTHDDLARRRRGARARRRRRSGTDRPRRARTTWRPRCAEHLVDGAVERARPGPRRAADERRREGEMALAAEDDLAPRR